MPEYTAEALREMVASGKAIPRFTVTEAAWYGNALVATYADRVLREWCIGIDSPEGGTFGEWMLQWVDLGRGKICPRWQIFGDGIQAFLTFPDVATVIELNDPTEIAVALSAIGFRDTTARVRP